MANPQTKLHCDEGVHYLSTDRRGTVFQNMAYEIEKMVVSKGTECVGALG